MAARDVRKTLTRAQWSMHCVLNDIDEHTATLGVLFRRLSKLEGQERAALAELEATLGDPACVVELLTSRWDDNSGRGTKAPSWWPRLPDGWRVGEVGRRHKRPTLEHRDGRLHVFESLAELVTFVRDLNVTKLPAPKLQRVRPRALMDEPTLHEAARDVGDATQALIAEYRSQLLEARGHAIVLARQLNEAKAREVELARRLEATHREEVELACRLEVVERHLEEARRELVRKDERIAKLERDAEEAELGMWRERLGAL